MRVVFLGNDAWSVPPLEALARSRHEVALTVTRVPRPAGRGGRLRATPVAEAAHGLDLPLRQVETVKRGEGFDAIAGERADALIVVAYGEILPASVLELAYPINLHFSLLPALRGADPVRRAILQGEVRTGVTVIRMDEGMDTGPILLQREVAIGEDEEGAELGDRLARLGGDLLVEALDLKDAGELEESPQPAEGTAAPKLTPADEWIDWNESAGAILRRVRALAPDPGARTRFRGKLLKVLEARAVDGVGAPGTISEVNKDGVTVAARSGAVELGSVVPEGRRRISAGEFARGFRPEPGETLG